jgi:hypothetical protein
VLAPADGGSQALRLRFAEVEGEDRTGLRAAVCLDESREAKLALASALV